MKYKINEIFYSIQGEGHFAGTPAIFIRFSGCNLKCPWCDTKKHEIGKYYTKERIEQEVDKIINANNLKDKPIIVISGGEPTLQLSDEEEILKGFYKTIETNGTGTVPKWVDWITCSPKTPINFKLSNADEYKFICEDKDKLEKLLSEVPKNVECYIQPLEQDGNMNIKDTIGLILKNPRLKLSLQTQKIIGVR